MIETYKNVNISMEYRWFCTKPSEQGSFFPSQLKWVQGVVCYDWNLQKRKYPSRISTVLHQTFRTGLVFLSPLKWVQGVVCYNRNLQKHKYLNRISMVLHETFRTGLAFLSWLKWVQRVACYDQNVWKHKYLNGDEFPITFKVNYILENLLPMMVTSLYNFHTLMYLNNAREEHVVTYREAVKSCKGFIGWNCKGDTGQIA